MVTLPRSLHRLLKAEVKARVATRELKTKTPDVELGWNHIVRSVFEEPPPTFASFCTRRRARTVLRTSDFHRLTPGGIDWAQSESTEETGTLARGRGRCAGL